MLLFGVWCAKIFLAKQETDELKSQVLRLRGDLSRLEKAFESRDTEDGHRVVDYKKNEARAAGISRLYKNYFKDSGPLKDHIPLSSIYFFGCLITT